MSDSVKKPFSLQSLLSVQTIVIAEIAWALMALMFFLLFSIPPEGGHPIWYSVGTYVFEMVAYLGAALLCFRNWKSPQIVSGRDVWSSIGFGMLFYFFGQLVFGYWELGLKQDPAVSPADFFFIATYLFLGWGMARAAFSRQLNLEIWQWGVVAAIAALGIVVASVTSATLPDSNPAQSLLMPPAIAQTPQHQQTAQPHTTPTHTKTTHSPAVKPPAKAPVVAPAKTPAKTATPTVKPATAIASPSAKPISKPVLTPASEPESPAPEWVKTVEAQLAPLETAVNLFYVVSDVALLIIATILLLAFWGGRFSMSWRMIAAAAFSLYIADIWFKYASRSADYQSGSLPEVFWVFSGVLFGIGAALEYDLSTRSRRTGSRRRGA